MTPEDRAKRRIGGSLIAKIVKQSKWGTPLDAYLELTGERPEEEKTGEDIDRGNFLEPALRDWASKKTGFSFFKPSSPGVLAHPEWEWATVSPDGLDASGASSSMRGGRLLEIKAPRRDDAQWGEEGTDEVPTDALLQTHWGLMVTDGTEGVVAALLGGELRIYRVARDKELEQKLFDAARAFVANHVLPRVPPPAEYGDDANVLFLHPKSIAPNRPWASLSQQERYVVATYLDKYAFESEALEALEGWEPVIKEVIGDASGIDAPTDPAEMAKLGGLKRVDWKSNATGGTKWKELAMSLLEGQAPGDIEKLKQEFAGSPARVLRPWFTKGKK